MANKYIIQRRTASGLETVAEIPALEGNKVDMSWLPVVGAMGSAIIERGSNANGDYIRWADGTQICWRNAIENFACTTLYSGLYYDSNGPTRRYTYPAEFIEPPSVSFNVSSTRSDFDFLTYIAGAISNGTTQETPNFTVLCLDPATQQVELRYIAIGRWK